MPAHPADNAITDTISPSAPMSAMRAIARFISLSPRVEGSLRLHDVPDILEVVSFEVAGLRVLSNASANRGWPDLLATAGAGARVG
jgi:hypothetical protein